MRALVVIPGRQLCGAERALVDLAGGLRARGYVPMVATPAGDPVDRAARDAGIETLHLAPGQRATGRARTLRALVGRKSADVVFAGTAADALSAAVAARWAGRSVVVRRVAADEELAAGWRTRVAAMVASVGVVMTRPTAPGRVAAALASGSLGVRLPDLPADVGATSGAPRLTCVTAHRAADGRALGDVLRAFALLRIRFAALRLAVVGTCDRALETSARLHAAALRVSEAVDWIADPRERPWALRRSTIGCVAAEGDDGAYGLLDLMAYGVPLIARRSPLTEHYVAHGIHGVLLPVLDAARMASELAVMLSSPQRREAMGHAARARVGRDFTEAAMVEPFDRVARGLRGHET